MAAGGKDRLNAMYMVDGYGENNPIVEKSQFIMSLVEQIDKAGVGPQQKSIIDRCTALVYQDAERTGKPATLCDLRNKLLEQPEEKAKEIALSLELFTTGSLDIFGHESTVDLDKRIVVFDIHGLGEQLKPTGLLVITDTILNRVTLNWKKGKRTHIFIDEFHVVFETSRAAFSSIPLGGSSERETATRPPSRRMWNICWTPCRQAPCFPTPSLWSYSIRRFPTVPSSRSS